MLQFNIQYSAVMIWEVERLGCMVLEIFVAVSVWCIPKGLHIATEQLYLCKAEQRGLGVLEFLVYFGWRGLNHCFSGGKRWPSPLRSPSFCTCAVTKRFIHISNIHSGNSICRHNKSGGCRVEERQNYPTDMTRRCLKAIFVIVNRLIWDSGTTLLVD